MMTPKILYTLMLFLLVLMPPTLLAQTDAPTPVPTETETPTATSTFTETPTATITFTETPTETPTATPTVVESPTETPTFIESPTETPTFVDAPTQTETPTATPTPDDLLELVFTENFDDGQAEGVLLDEGWLYTPRDNGLMLTTTEDNRTVNISVEAEWVLEAETQWTTGAVVFMLPVGATLTIDAAGNVTLTEAEAVIFQTTLPPISAWVTLRFSNLAGMVTLTLNGQMIFAWQPESALPAGTITITSRAIPETPYFLALDNISLWKPVPPIFTETPEVTPTGTPTETPTATATPIPLRLEAEDSQILQTGLWTFYETEAASGGGYLYSSGSPDDSLTLHFDGSWAEVIYIEHPDLGSFAIEVDGELAQTIVSTAETASFGKIARIDNLTAGSHTLRIYPLGGMVAVDALMVEVGITATPTPSPTPILVPVEGLAVYQNHQPDNLGIQIQILDADGTVLYTAQTQADGTYLVEVPAEIPFRLAADAPKHRPFEILLEPEQPLPDIMLAGGDLNDDGCINVQDIELISSILESSTDTLADINGDGLTGAADLAILTGNFDAACTPAAPPINQE